VGLRQKKEDFFFEKKKQKTFALAYSAGVHVLTPVSWEKRKSFLVLFFKKEHS
jgi:hypothetical protein